MTPKQKKLQKQAEEILEMLGEPVLSTNQRLKRIEKELRKLKRAGVLHE